MSREPRNALNGVHKISNCVRNTHISLIFNYGLLREKNSSLCPLGDILSALSLFLFRALGRRVHLSDPVVGQLMALRRVRESLQRLHSLMLKAGEAHKVPKLRVSSDLGGSLLETEERLLIVVNFEEGDSEVEKDFASLLGDMVRNDLAIVTSS